LTELRTSMRTDPIADGPLRELVSVPYRLSRAAVHVGVNGLDVQGDVLRHGLKLFGDFRLRYPERATFGPQRDARLSVFSGVEDQFATH
jgi:hypothetical protein